MARNFKPKNDGLIPNTIKGILGFPNSIMESYIEAAERRIEERKERNESNIGKNNRRTQKCYGFRRF